MKATLVRFGTLEEGARRGIEVVACPTAEACALLEASDPTAVAAVLHVTC